MLFVGLGRSFLGRNLWMANANVEYARLYEAREIQEIRDLANVRRRQGLETWRLESDGIRRRMKRQKATEAATVKAIDDLDRRLREEFADVYKADERLGILEVERNKALNDLAPSVTHAPLQDRACFLRASHVSTWRTQGYGAGKYAQGELVPDQVFLRDYGYAPHVRFVRGQGRYELWADCEQWALDAITRVRTLREAVEILKRNCLNPLVYMPSLPREMAEF
jgi:hypothetical protein